MNLIDAVRRADFWRASPSDRPEHEYNEWIHFVVLHPEMVLLLNFAVQWSPDEGRWAGVSSVIARSRRWVGAVERVPADRLSWSCGGMDAVFGAHDVRYGEQGWTVRAALPDARVEVTLTPDTVPAAASRLPFAAKGGVRWVLVPRLRVSGRAIVDGVEVDLAGSTAYHDHNWGPFAWGGDFVWEWMFWHEAPGDAPLWTAVASRLLDRGRHTSRLAGLMAWQGQGYARMFTGAEVSHALIGSRELPVGGRYPPALGLLCEGDRAMLPAQLRVEGRRGPDALALTLDTVDVSQVLVPDQDNPLGIVVIQEVEVEGRLRGVVRGARVDAAGRGVAELVRVR